MEINYKNKKLEKECTKISNAQKAYGEIAKKIILRINQFKASKTLEEMGEIRSARLHRLKGDRKNELAVDLNGNYRLVFTADDGNNSFDKIKVIKIEKVEDYH